MTRVYWTVKGRARYKDFEDLGSMLKFMERVRKNPLCDFVSSCTMNPNHVGKPGVAEVGPDYNWTKRRRNMPRVR